MKKKKMCTKFRHWLIKKLGGYTTPVGSVNVCTTNKNIITLDTCIAVPTPSARGYDNANLSVEWLKENYPVDLCFLKGSIADRILELDDNAIDIYYQLDPITNQLILKARVRIAVNDKEV